MLRMVSNTALLLQCILYEVEKERMDVENVDVESQYKEYDHE